MIKKSIIYQKINQLFILQQCAICAKIINHNLDFCTECLDFIPYNKEIVTNSYMSYNKEYYPFLQRNIIPFAYNYPINKFIIKLKYQQKLIYGKILARLFLYFFPQKLSTIDAILPVPLHRERLIQRGFNQSLVISKYISSQLKLKLLTNYVKRNKNNLSQTQLSYQQRYINVANVFSLVKNINYNRVAIFDDVITTGATTLELVKLLSKNGVKHIEIWALARQNIQ